jgi:ketosteroid isomerase-like protein
MTQTAVQIVLDYQDAWTNGDFDRAAAYLAPDFSFDGPLAQHRSAEEFIKGLKNFAATIRPGWKKTAAYGDENGAILLYDVVFHSGTPLRIADYLSLRNGRIQAETIVYDTALLQRELVSARATTG